MIKKIFFFGLRWTQISTFLQLILLFVLNVFIGYVEDKIFLKINKKKFECI